MDTNAYWTVRGGYEDRKKALAEMSREHLEATILDGEYNDFLRARDSYREDEVDPHGHGKRIPYIGWFWRHVSFSQPDNIPIGDCHEFIGFMENNKWDYRQRNLKRNEFERVICIIDEAMELNSKGGDLSEIEEATNAKLDELWDYMQTLTI